MVYGLPKKNLDESRGKAANIELYHLTLDISEAHDSAAHYPQLISQLTNELRSVIENGTSKPDMTAVNDVEVDFETIQEQRWAPLIQY